MTLEHIIAVVEMYEAHLAKEGVPKGLERTPGSLSEREGYLHTRTISPTE